MKKIIIFFLFIKFSLSAQVKGIVIDSQGNPVPYVNIWVENENNGTTSEKNGSFSINLEDKAKMLIFSAVGFEKLKLKASDAEKVILKQAVFELDEVVIKQPTGGQLIEIGTYKKSDIHFYYGCWDKPWTIAKFFSNNDSIGATSFIKKITIMSESYKNNATFKVRLFEVNDDGSPGNDLLGENIIVKVKSGKHNNEVDLTPYKIIFPEKGFFVSIEFLIIENNKYEVKMKGLKGKTYTYQPSIGAVPSETATTWRNLSGTWHKIQTKATNKNPEAYYDKFADLAIKLTLTN
ncbi:MAG: carboxypeptidase-like regulatory domain-containing protein [Flavobacterium sp.]|nr:carboxypeptidase-like regulatory domain-containing protein [Flavobacterium sp.]